MQRLWYFLLNLDEAFAALFFAHCPKDMSISAYCYREGYTRWVKLIDALFFLDPDHCHTSYLAYLQRSKG